MRELLFQTFRNKMFMMHLTVSFEEKTPVF